MRNKLRSIAPIVAIFLAIAPKVAFPYPWPVEGAHPVNGTLGEWRDGHLHAGVDIGRGVGTRVLAVAAGTIPEGGLGSNFIKAGSFDYIHIVRNPALQVGQEIQAGAFVGTVADENPPHLHIEEGDGASNPLRAGGLDGYSDTARTYVYTLEFFGQGTETHLPDELYGQVDILSQAKDSQSGGGSSTVAVHRIGYQVVNNANTVILGPEFNLQFDSVVGGSLGLVYANFGTHISNRSTYHYWVTNTKSEKRYWNTKLRAGEQWNGADARTNAEAAYPDGQYAISSLAFDIANNGGNLAAQEGALTLQKKIDNFRPFLRRAIIGNEIRYAKEWTFNGTNVVSPGPSPNQPLAPGNYMITLEFSEPIVGLTGSIDTLGNMTFTSTEPTGSQRIFTAPLVVGIGSPIQDGERTLTVNATDLAGHSLLALDRNAMSISPTQLARDAGGGGPDSQVFFTVKHPPTPTVTIRTEYEILFDRMQGKALNTPTTRASSATVFIHDYNSDIDVNSIILPGTPEVTSSDARDRVVRISGLIPGNTYAFSVKNASGGVTQGSWRVENLALVVNGASSAFDATADGFSGSIHLNADSTASGGAEKIIQYDPTTQTKITDWGVGPFISTFSASRPNIEEHRFFSLRDSEGNSAYQNLAVFEWVYSFPEEPGQTGSMIHVEGAGSTTLVIPAPVNATPGQSGVILPGVIRSVKDDPSSLNLQFSRIESTSAVPLLTNPPDSTFNLTINGQTVATGRLTNDGWGNATTDISSAVIPVSGAMNVGLTVTFSGVGNGACRESSGGMCTKPLIPFAAARPLVRALQYGMNLPSLSPHIPVFDGENQTVSLGNGVTLLGFDTTGYGLIAKATLLPGFVEEGNINLLGDRIYDITASTPPPAFTPPFTIRLPFDKTKSTGKPVHIVRFDPCRLSSFTATTDYTNGIAEAAITGFGRFAVVESKYSAPRNVDSGQCHFVSGSTSVVSGASPGTAGYAQAVNVFRSLGLKTIAAACKFGPTNTPFSPPGEMKICYDPAAMNQPDITDQDLDIFQFSEAGVQERLAGMFHDRQRGFVTGSVSRFSSQFGAFAHVSPIPASDLLPPITTLSLDGQALPLSPSYVASTTSTLTLAAADPLFPGAPQSGVAATFLLLDTPFVDTATTPGNPYAGPFALSAGTHTLAYYSADVAGNIESVSTVTVLANPPPSRGVAGLGIGRDPANRLWTVALDGGAVKLARTDEAGAAAASAPLPEALSNGRWGILFDQAGDAYAVGAAEGPSTQASDLAVYKATPNGDAISSSRFFDGGSGSGDFIFDVAAPGWIGGAIESQGETLTAALWRFDPADGAVSLSTTFASGAAMGVAGDTDGSVWTAGFVRNPAPRSSRVYDLGLWHFAADGRTLAGGPFVVEAYAADLSLTDAAKILVSSNTVTVVAPRGRPGGGTDLGTTRFEKSSGAVLSESAWRAGDGSSAYPAALLPDGDGSLAGGGLDDGATRAALWRFGADGALVSASLADAGGARGAVTLGADHWLSVDDATAPYKLTGESSAAGALADVRAPRVVLVAGLPSFTDGGGTLFASATAQFSFSVADDKLVSGDGLGAGVTTVFYRADSTGAFTAFANPFSFAAEGAHAVEFYGVDAADNPGPILLRSVTVDQTAPATQAAQNGAEITLTASDGSGSGVARIRYLVDYGNPDVCNNVAEATGAPRGTCENPWYAGPFTLSNGPHTIYFQAFDAVGNAEVLRATYPFVEAPGSGPSAGGMGIGKDPLDTFWTAVSENDAISFAHSDSSGVLISSAALPDAVSGFPWSVLFDQDGRAYAVGGAAGPATQALDLAVYKASPAGDAVESRTLFDSGYANNDIAFDAKAPGWIVGAAQTSGPTDLEAAGGGEFSMALWRFDATLGTVQLKATYARAGFDLGAGLAVDADGSLWIAGYSLSPEAPAVGGFDLALWHYAANGQTLLGGPFLRPGYLDNLDGGLTARVFVSSQAVYVAAPRANNSGGTDMAFLRYDKASGLPTSEIAWRPADGAPSYPIAVLPEASGLLVAGGIGGDLTETGLWRFGFDGALQSVTTTDAGGATGAVFRGSELWLSVDGSTVPYRVQSETAVAGALVDFAPPRTSLAAGTPSSVEAQTVYVTSATPLGFAVADDYLVAGDGLGVGATQTFYAEAGGAFARFTSSFTLVAEGTHTISFFSVDREGRAEAVKTQSVGVDLTAPAVTLVSSGTIFSITAVDPLVNGAASGVRQIQYLVDSDVECNVAQSTSAPPGTCENLSYAGPFELAVGTHTVYYAAEDNLANGLEVVYSSYITVGQPVTGPVLTPSSGPIGVPFSITGTGFGVYSGANTRVKFGTAVAPVSVWNNTTISGTIPGLSTGSYAVAIERQNASSVTSVSAGNFAVTDLNTAALNVSSGPIGVPFTITGTGFGPYAGTLSRVLVDGATAPLSVWNNTTITGTLPGVTPGAKTIVIQRAAGSFLSTSDGFAFEVTVPSVTAVSPSSGPIGAAYTLTGFSFGPYAGANTRVLIGGATTALSLWNDRTIKGTVPGSLSPGVQTVVVQRLTAGGGFVESGAASFQVAGVAFASLAPSSGPIGVPFMISGAGFGAYDGANTRVKFNGVVAPVSVWNDSTITGTIPALSTGVAEVVVERQQGAFVAASGVSSFTVVELTPTGMTPETGPIGTAFTITGSGFGPYNGANTRLMIGGVAASLSLWNDTTISGTIPDLPAGAQPLWLERLAGTGVQSSATNYFEVTTPAVASMTPSSAPIGAPFTITGTSFGAYGGANTRVTFNGVVAALSLWNDTTITGTVPAVPAGVVDVVVERQQGTGVVASSASAFTVLDPAVGGLSPSAGPIGTAFTLTGSGFGPYAGANTRVLIGGAVASLSLWNDTTITGTIPALPSGVQPVWLERSAGSGVSSSATSYFNVTTPEVASLTPSSAPIGAPFTITGTSFGAYAGANTRVKFNGVTAPLSVWNDTTITGTVPGTLPPGDAEVIVERAAGAGLVVSATQAFYVVAPAISTVSPSFGPVGTVVTVTGAGFGPYSGTLTRLLVGGATVPLSVWNDTTIRWTVPSSLSDGEYPVVVERSPAGGTVQSASATFTVGTGYSGASFAFASTLSLAATPDTHFEGDMALSSATGGRIDTPAKAAVDIPPNAMEEDTEITLKRIKGDGLRAQAAEEIQRKAAGEPIEFGPEGTRFATPVTIELPYDPALTKDETKIAIHYYNPLRREWEELPSVVDRARKVVTAKTDHFSIYQPMGLAPTAASQDEFYFRDAYAFPNPSRGGAQVTFRIQPGLAETVEVRVYDLSGRKVHASSDFTFLGAIDDGNGKGAQNTYDHVWGVSGVGSGVYNFVIKASQRGNKPITKSGKVGVVK